MLDDGAPIFSQVADRLADEIADGALREGDRAPSSNELASFYRINPATAAKGINVLMVEGLLEKRRGVGMFVAQGARAHLLARRRRSFVEHYVEPMVGEAARLGIGPEPLLEMVRSTLALPGRVQV
ncbi:MAG TPA: GntR family transcriptional regulator [Acidimicrobiales bacterium]|nr:GntR family transcriptional regulator [Acidimicrobiales bacterium]